VGATLRLPDTFAVGRLGGRNWTIISALLIIAATTGFGGGHFASSMTNLSW
jgi:NNP family nitrate/nitrite transporter-like MFS transporter